VRDAQGNILTTYTAQGSSTDDAAALDLRHDELYMYGSSRLGSYTIGESVDGGPDDMQFYHGTGFNRGRKQYELTNHLGNVLATISDRKFAVPSDTNSSLIDHYEPDIVTAQDYYPFGMLSRVAVPNDGSTYRFGFNGKMMDNDVKGLGNQINYGDRILDTRVGRFLSLDPLQTKFPFLTPYQFCSNSPIDGVDVDGRERVDFRLTIKDGAPQLDKIGEGPRTQRLLENFWQESKIPQYFRIEYQGQHYLFSDAPGVREYGSNLDIRSRPVYPLEQMPEFFSNPSGFVSTEDKEKSELHDHLVFNYKVLLFSGMATPRSVGKTPTEQVNEQTTSANNGNTVAAETNSSSNRPSWQQTETDVVTPDYREQVAFKNGTEVPKNTRGSVRPEGYQPGESIEAKNYNLATEKGISSMIRNVTKQVRQRQTNLPANTTQNIVLDVRGQNLTTKQLMTIRSRLMTQTGTKNVKVSFKTQ
jgi:RHS repeat-associated protein